MTTNRINTKALEGMKALESAFYLKLIENHYDILDIPKLYYYTEGLELFKIEIDDIVILSYMLVEKGYIRFRSISDLFEITVLSGKGALDFSEGDNMSNVQINSSEKLVYDAIGTTATLEESLVTDFQDQLNVHSVLLSLWNKGLIRRVEGSSYIQHDSNYWERYDETLEMAEDRARVIKFSGVGHE